MTSPLIVSSLLSAATSALWLLQNPDAEPEDADKVEAKLRQAVRATLHANNMDPKEISKKLGVKI
jgi:hypothetical protein